MTKWQDTNQQVDRSFSLYFEFTALQWIPVLFLTHVSTSTSPCACLWYEHRYVFRVFGLQVKWNQFSSNNSHYTCCIHKGLHAGKWPALMTSKPDSVSTLGYHWTDHTGRPLEPQVHWHATGTTLTDAITQWCSGVDPVIIFIIGTHWNSTGRPLEDHWKHIGNTLATNNYCPVAFQCTLGSKFQANWIATELPLAQSKGCVLFACDRVLGYCGVRPYPQHITLH